MLSPNIALGPVYWPRFERKFIPEPNSGCWLWFGCQHEGGYGRFKFEDQLHPAHRLLYERCHEIELPRDVFACHRCDTPCCVNPDHVFPGNQAANLADCIAKDRMHRGQRNGRSKLTDGEAEAIRIDPRPYRLIALQYGLHVEHVGAIKRGVRRAGAAYRRIGRAEAA